MYTINPFRGIYHMAVTKHMADVEHMGLQKGEALERLSRGLIWPWTVMASVALLMITFCAVSLVVYLADFAWHLITTY